MWTVTDSELSRDSRIASLAGLAIPEIHQKVEETLWREETKRLRKQLAGQEKEIEELRERVAELAGENAILLREFTKDKIN